MHGQGRETSRLVQWLPTLSPWVSDYHEVERSKPSWAYVLANIGAGVWMIQQDRQLGN